MRLLVVDDEPDMAKGLRRILQVKDYEVRIAHSGEEAVQQVRAWAPDGILMDIKMPGMNGVQAYRTIRTICPEAFVIFMTAYSSMAEQARAEGAAEVLTKPLNIEATCELIAKCFATRPVLIVDDDADFCLSLSRILKGKGWDVQTATAADDAIALFEKQPRCAVLLDMRLEDATGLDVLRAIKQLHAQALVIQMTGFVEMEGLMQQGLQLSATACFHKPLDIDGLLATIQSAAKHSS